MRWNIASKPKAMKLFASYKANCIPESTYYICMYICMYVDMHVCVYFYIKSDTEDHWKHKKRIYAKYSHKLKITIEPYKKGSRLPRHNFQPRQQCMQTTHETSQHRTLHQQKQNVPVDTNTFSSMNQNEQAETRKTAKNQKKNHLV